MKKILLLSIISFFTISCTLTNEQKAELIIQKDLKESLFHPDSYEPVSTHIDSMFIDSSTFGSMINIREELEDMLVKLNKYERELRNAEESMDLWAPSGYVTQFSRGNYERARKDKIEAETNFNKINKKIQEKIVELKDVVESRRKGEFTGWLALHRYRGLNGAGTMTISSDVVFLFDIDFQSYYVYEWDKFEKIIELITIIEDTSTCDDDILDFIEDNRYSIF